jgi:hypothetical protein
MGALFSHGRGRRLIPASPTSLRATPVRLGNARIEVWRSPAIAKTPPLEQHDEQREAQDIKTQFRDRRIVESAIEADEMEERTQRS